MSLPSNRTPDRHRLYSKIEKKKLSPKVLDKAQSFCRW
jgi:hypothetical protein